jgi:hypothetical protein
VQIQVVAVVSLLEWPTGPNQLSFQDLFEDLRQLAARGGKTGRVRGG